MITKQDIIEILESKIKWYERIEAIPPLRDKVRNVIAVNITKAILKKLEEKDNESKTPQNILDRIEREKANQKYLNRDEVEKLYEDFINEHGIKSSFITAICKLGIKPKDKTKVICEEDTCQNCSNNICTLEEITLIVDSGGMVCIDYIAKYKKYLVEEAK